MNASHSLCLMIIALLFAVPSTLLASPRDGVTIAEREAEPRLNDLVITAEIVDRKPHKPSATYPKDVGTLFCWVSTRNLSAPATLSIIWRHDDAEVIRQTMEVGVSTRWRSWVRRRVNPRRVGRWSCEIRDAEGISLGKATATVK